MGEFIYKQLTILLIFTVFSLPCFALQFDASVDEEIRKNYNPSKLELEALPPLPNTKPVTEKQPVTSIPKSAPINTTNSFPKLSAPTQKPVISNFDKSTAIRIKKGTKFKVQSCKTVSNWSGKGTVITFISQQSVSQRYITIPQGTIFKGKVIDSHGPQKGTNGGLIVIEVNKMVFKGSTVGIDAVITKANHKHIYFNNIKGKNTYFNSMAKSTKPGKKFYKKMAKTTSKLASDTRTLIFSPFTAVTGVVVYGTNILGTPVLALFNKGGSISIPAGSDFEIKLLEDVYFY